MQKIISIFKWRFDLPSRAELKAISRRFSHKEQIIFLVLTLFLFLGIIGILWNANTIFSVQTPSHSGAWKEGTIGFPHVANPLLAVSDIDRDLVMLLYSGLLRADGKGRLEPDLADSFTISEDGMTYAFTLKENLFWHDGKKLTADDIAFTVNFAKNPTLKSPLRASWEGINVEVIDERNIRFHLDRPYAPFVENTTLGILPKHIWQHVTPEQMSLSKYNLRPIGSGPYKIKKVDQNSSGTITTYTLESFNQYARGEPFIDTFEFKFYSSEKNMKTAFQKGDIDAIGGLSPQGIEEIETSDTITHTLSLPRVFGVFLNQNRVNAFTKREVREALQLTANKEEIIRTVFAGKAEPIFSPIPPGTFSALTEIEDEYASATTPSAELAIRLLEKAGWAKDKKTGKLKTKKGEPLSFTLATSNVSDLIQTADLLKSAWESIGIEVEIKKFELNDLNQNVIRPREYDALLFGEVVGRDPDPFAFWHSSQRNDPGLNIALYANVAVDKLLEDARKIANEEKRKEKYVQFQKEIIEDVPAIFLYSPLYLYTTRTNLKGFNTQHITIPAERYAQVHQWYVNTKKILQFFD